MQTIERSSKERRVDGAAANSRKHMSGMYDYTGVDKRIYQTEKRMPRSDSRYTRIQSKEELKHRADLTVTVRNIRMAEGYLDGKRPMTPTGEVEKKYGLKYDESELKTYGDSVAVFQMLCDAYPMAKNYVAWGDLLQCIKDHKPVRTEPVKIIRPAQENNVMPVDEVKPIYEKGTVLWTIYRVHVPVECDRCSGRGRIAASAEFVRCTRCDGTGMVESKTETRPAVAMVTVVSWYKKRMNDGSYDVMYELDGHGAFGKNWDGTSKPAWRLQGGGNLFEKEEDALAFIRKENT